MRHKYLVKSLRHVWPIYAAAFFNLAMAYWNWLRFEVEPTSLRRFLVAMSAGTCLYCLTVGLKLMWQWHKLDAQS